MSIMAMAWAKNVKTGDSSTKLVLLVLADWANPGPTAGPRPDAAEGRHYMWADQDAVAEACEMSLSSVKRHERTLAALGLIQKEKRFSRSGNRLSDFIILAVDGAGARPFPVAIESAKGQFDPWPPPAETSKGQIDLRSPVTPGPKFTGDPYITVVPNGNEPPPTSSTAPLASESVGAKTEEEGSAITETPGQVAPRQRPAPAPAAGLDQVLDAVLAGAGVNSDCLRPSIQRFGLLERLGRAVDAGWTPPQLVAALGAEPLTGARSVFAVLSSRIAGLGSPPSLRHVGPPAVPWCGACEIDGYRWRLDGQGVPYRCPECNPRAGVPTVARSSWHDAGPR